MPVSPPWLNEATTSGILTVSYQADPGPGKRGGPEQNGHASLSREVSSVSWLKITWSW